MTSDQKKLLAGCVIGMSVAPYPMIAFTFGIYLLAVINEVGLDRSVAVQAYSIFLLCSGIGLLKWGKIIDRWGARKSINLAVCVMVIVIVALSLTFSIEYWLALHILIGLMSGGVSTVAYFWIITRWFKERRGLAMGMTMAGGGLTAFVAPLLVDASIRYMGWRWTYVLMGLIMATVTLMVSKYLLRDTPLPPHHNLVPESAEETIKSLGIEKDETQVSLGNWKKPFWLIAAPAAVVAAVAIGILGHLTLWLGDMGVSNKDAAFVLSCVGVASLFGRVLTGWLLDRMFAPYVAAIVYASAGLGLALMPYGSNVAIAACGGALLGVAVGAEGDIVAYMVSKYFRLESFGRLFSYVYTGIVVGSVAGSAGYGYAYHSSGRYDQALPVMLMAIGAAVVAVFFLGDYRVKSDKIATC